MTRPAPRWLRTLAVLLIRGAEAPYVRVDLDDAFARETARGLSRAAASRRYLANVLLSAVQVLRRRSDHSALRLSWVDVRLGARMLIKHPMLTAVALFALSVALPVTLAPAHLAQAVESHMPEDPEGRLQLLRLQPGSTTINDLVRWRASLTSFEALAGVRPGHYNVDVDGSTHQVLGAEVSASLFTMLGTPPIMGRALVAADEVPGAEPVVVVGQRLWLDRFGGRGLADRVWLRIGGQPHRVVGVMPEAFQFPVRQHMWLPLRDQVAASRRLAARLFVFGRLSGDATADGAHQELSSVALAGEAPEPGDERVRAEVVPASFMMFNFPRGGLRATPDYLFARLLTTVPLLIACINVGLLIFARSAARESEFAVRSALGASRGRILTQVFTESSVLVLLATGAGLWLLHWLPARVLTSMGVTLPYWIPTGVTVPIVLQGLVVALLAAAVAGVIPVLRSTGRALQQTLQQARQRGQSGARFGGLSSVLIVADVAAGVAAIGLAVAIGLQVERTAANPDADGIVADRYLSFTLQRAPLPGEPRVTDQEGADVRLAQTQQALVDRLKAESGVRNVTVASVLPRMTHPNARVEVEGGPAVAGSARLAQVTPDYFESLGQPVVMGRGFQAGDLPPSAHTAIVNTSFVTNLLGGGSAIGRRVRLLPWDPRAEPGPWLEIVGVVGHLGMRSVNPDRDNGLYRPLRPGALPDVRFAVEVDGDVMALAPRVRHLAAQVDPQAVVGEFATLDRVFEGDWYIMAAAVVGGLVLVGVLLTLAVSALYAILSFTVAQRTREIGIRIALGADRWQVVWHVARRAMIQIAAGVFLGMCLTGPVVYDIVREVNPLGSTVLAAVAALLPGLALLVVVALVSCAAPALRALRISPVEALRTD